jgi:hypothetical protein
MTGFLSIKKFNLLIFKIISKCLKNYLSLLEQKEVLGKLF